MRDSLGPREERIVGSNREDARQIFEEWLDSQAIVNGAVTFVERQNDVGTLRIDTSLKDDYTARDLIGRYGASDRTPLRVIDVRAPAEGVVEVDVLLAETGASPWHDGGRDA